MDMDFFNLTPEAQMDLLNMMMLMDNDDNLSFPQQSPPPPPPPPSPSPSPSPQFAPTYSPPPLSFNVIPEVSYVDETHASVAAMREMIFRMAAMQPVDEIDPETIKPPKRRNVRVSKDPQSVAARQRRERISERMRILQRLVPGGTKMDTASMLDEAIHYVKFLKAQVQSLERANAAKYNSSIPTGINYY